LTPPKPPGLAIRQNNAGVTVAVRLTPKSARDEIVSVEDFGRANAALEKLIAKWVGVPPSHVKVAQGGKSRLKQVAIDGDPAALTVRVVERLADLDKP